MGFKQVAALAAIVAISGCASRGAPTAAAPAAAPAPASAQASAADAKDGFRAVPSKDGSFQGEEWGTPAPGSKFSKLAIGMEFDEVTKLIGAPSNMTTHETGKRWIPFYFGNDVTRMEVTYPGEGCLTFTGGNAFGAGGHQLERIIADPTMAKCK